MKKIISKPNLLENAKKIREREKQELNTQLRELQQIPVRRYSNGEYIPLNYNDLELREWCRKFNRKLRNCKALITQQITPIRLCGIQSGLQQYAPYSVLVSSDVLIVTFSFKSRFARSSHILICKPPWFNETFWHSLIISPSIMQKNRIGRNYSLKKWIKWCIIIIVVDIIRVFVKKCKPRVKKGR